MRGSFFSPRLLKPRRMHLQTFSLPLHPTPPLLPYPMNSRKYKSLVPLSEQRIEVLWELESTNPDKAAASSDATKKSEYWWPAEVKGIVLVADSPYLAYAKLVYDPYKNFEESILGVRFYPGKLLSTERNPTTCSPWRYEQSEDKNDMDWTPQALPVPESASNVRHSTDTLALASILTRLGKLEATVLSQETLIHRLQDTAAQHHLRLRPSEPTTRSSSDLNNLLGLIRIKLGVACRVLKSKPPRTERVVPPNASQPLPSQTEGAEETIDTITRRTTSIELDCPFHLFEALAAKIHGAYVATDNSTSADVQFYPSYREIRDHPSRVSHFHIYLPTLFHVANTIGVTKDTDLDLLILRTNGKKSVALHSKKASQPPSIVTTLRIAGTYVYSRTDVLRPSYIVLGGSYPRISIPSAYDDDILPVAQRPVLSLTRKTREWDVLRARFVHRLKALPIAPPNSALYTSDNSKPARLERYYFSWKPLPGNSTEFTSDMATAPSIQHGKLILNCPYLQVCGVNVCEDFLSLWNSESPSFVSRMRTLL